MHLNQLQIQQEITQPIALLPYRLHKINFKMTKKHSTINFYQKRKELKLKYKNRESQYVDSICRIVKQVSRQIAYKTQTSSTQNIQSQGQIPPQQQTQNSINQQQLSSTLVLQMKAKISQLSLVYTQQEFQNFGKTLQRQEEVKKLRNQMEKMNEKRSQKKTLVIGSVNYVRKVIRDLQRCKLRNHEECYKD